MWSSTFPLRRSMFGKPDIVHALDGVSMSVGSGELIALVGESGSGKTTLARCILGLATVTSGSILLEGHDVTQLTGEPTCAPSGDVSSPCSRTRTPRSIHAGRSQQTVREPLDAYGVGTSRERDRTVERLLDRVGLPPRFAQRRPHELSGGQRQRVGIAAALALEPDLIVADEPVSALDVSVQAQILNLLVELNRDLGVAIVLITHNLAVVEHICDRAVVLYLGRIAEEGPGRTALRRPGTPLYASADGGDPLSRTLTAA